jgi:hypothetical protein
MESSQAAQVRLFREKIGGERVDDAGGHIGVLRISFHA